MLDTLLQIGHALHVALHSGVGRATLVGIGVAAKGDWAAFQAFKSFDEFTAYNWRVAIWRWTQGAIIGAGMAAGVTEFL